MFLCFARSVPGTSSIQVRVETPRETRGAHLTRRTLHRSLAGPSRWLATAAAEASTSAPPPPPANADPKISKIVDDISGLTLLQASDLVTLLKVRALFVPGVLGC